MSKVQTETILLPMGIPPVGSTNPSASLPTLWGYILPALNHIACSLTDTPEKAPVIDHAYHMGIHTTVNNYITTVPNLPVTACQLGMPANKEEHMNATGMDLYLHLDKFSTDFAWELLLSAPEDDATLVQYLIPCFKRYAVGAHSINLSELVPLTNSDESRRKQKSVC